MPTDKFDPQIGIRGPLDHLPPNSSAETADIAVAEKIIADISTGIYRTPAAALKELVTNAYDADATEVIIKTNPPAFDSLVVKDNGVGMTLERFLEVFKHIGGSWKRIQRPDGRTEHYHRAIIGRIGIGLLAVAQLGQRFYVSSTVKGKASRFLAEVDLTPFHKDDAAMKSLAPIDPDKQITIGHIRYLKDIPENKASQFTVVTVPDPKKGLVSELYSQLRLALGAVPSLSITSPPRNFAALVNTVHQSKRAYAALDGYFHLLWELGLLAPVNYLPNAPFKKKSRHIEGVENISIPAPQKFSVLFDGYDVRRPILFPNPVAEQYGGPDPIAYPISFSRTVAGRLLAFSGYIYGQKPHIDPVELQGVQIRIRGVGIGNYDRSWMGYPFDEGVKFGQITGEVFVSDGLESALNIDRASFRETDPHYLAVRAFLWDVLQQKVFPDVKSRQGSHRKQRLTQEREVNAKELYDSLEDAPETVSGETKLVEQDKGSKGSASRQLEGKKSAAQYQMVVSVAEETTLVDKAVFNRIAKSMPADARERLLRVCTVLAAYGLWDTLNQEDAENLIRSLAVAVHI